MCSKPIFCSKIALKGKTCSRLLKPQKVAPNAKSCSKVAEHNRDRPTWLFIKEEEVAGYLSFTDVPGRRVGSITSRCSGNEPSMESTDMFDGTTDCLSTIHDVTMTTIL